MKMVNDKGLHTLHFSHSLSHFALDRERRGVCSRVAVAPLPMTLQPTHPGSGQMQAEDENPSKVGQPRTKERVEAGAEVKS